MDPRGGRAAIGGPGDDFVTIDPSAAAFQVAIFAAGDDGDDVLIGGTWQSGHAGNDRLSGLFAVPGFPGRAFGGPGDDILIGTEAGETLYGDWESSPRVLREDQGDDTIFGGAGDDILVGGAGRDLLSGGAGNDIVFGNQGRDRLRGGSGDDELRGGKGFDVLFGGGGMNSCSSGSDKDRGCP